MGFMNRVREEANSAIDAATNTNAQQFSEGKQHVVLQMTLKEMFIGTGSNYYQVMRCE